jgi:RAD50-interacting protein 1
VAQRALFLIKIQLPILDSYHSRISASLEAFETLSSIFVRPVPGALSVNLTSREASGIQEDDPRILTVGVAGVLRLCKAWLSAGYIEASLEEWGEDIVSANISCKWTPLSLSSTSFLVFSTALGRVWY